MAGADGVSREVEAMAARMGAQSRSQRAIYAARLAIYRRKVRAYRKVFIGPDGKLTDAGALVLADLGRLAGLGVARRNRSTEEIQFDEGQRRIVLHMIASMHLDTERLARMADKLRESDDE